MADKSEERDLSWESVSSSTSFIRYISASEASSIDEELMSPEGCGYLLPQLMELAGLACAHGLFKLYPPDVCNSLLVLAGPGNQGGDALVAARHAKLWGYEVQVWYPKPGKTEIFTSLRKQLDAFHIPVIIDEDDFDDALQSANVVLDGIFGFSFKGPPRPPFAAALDALSTESRHEFVSRTTRPPIVSIDIPSGWSVDDGAPNASSSSNTSSGNSSTGTGSKVDTTADSTFTPEVVISLTAPKKGMKNYQGRHLLGGRFVPPHLAHKYRLEGITQGYAGDEQVLDITGWPDADDLVEVEDGA